MYQLCKGVDHCHSCAVLHRKGILKVGGLGLWRGLNSPVMNNTDEIGLFYRAPETLLGAIEYSNGVDIWSVGCIFAEMVRGYPFFHGDTELMQLILIFRVLGTPNEETWHGVSELEGWHEYPQWNPGNMDAFFPSLDPTGIDLLSKMLVCDPAKRVSAKEALNHPYFDNLDKSQF
ncbi:Cyclin-dependent kinase B1-1 [Apostasia shenzhenica]|uniref:Cyclin-dependent kinase B1-1 n=1 Tax=Apostasia shenzhenica TaxID=1088818 RepID=A0A2I0AXL9_9ASPA|nr:Cyclin-dependent kinase B1-1 [Apostasia shenzhenica]